MESLVLMSKLIDRGFWNGRRVLLTGHTGFKGGWAALWLRHMGADVHGLALAPATDPNLFTLLGLDRDFAEGIGDIRDRRFVEASVQRARPQIVLHMAAQPLVRRAIQAPIETFDVNIIGTANLLESLRHVDGIEAIIVVTTDKVYENSENGRSFVETDALGGHDPYSASKAAVELVTASFARTFFESRGVPVATARGGNVIGGGDFSEDRLVPDIFRAARAKETLVLRNPDATRPWQHVLDCVGGYLAYAQKLARRESLPRAMNFGPLDRAGAPVRVLAEAMQEALGAEVGWCLAATKEPREMQALALDCSLARDRLGFRDRLVGRAAIRSTADWYLAFSRGGNMRDVTLEAIEDYLRS